MIVGICDACQANDINCWTALTAGCTASYMQAPYCTECAVNSDSASCEMLTSSFVQSTCGVTSASPADSSIHLFSILIDAAWV